MTLVEKINERYNVAQQNLIDIYNAPPTTYREQRDYQKAIAAGRKPVKQTKNTLQIVHQMQEERKYVNEGMNYVIQFIVDENQRNGGIYNELLEKIGFVDEEVIQAAYEKITSR